MGGHRQRRVLAQFSLLRRQGRHARRPDPGPVRRRPVPVRPRLRYVQRPTQGRILQVPAPDRRRYPVRSADLLHRQFPWQQHRCPRPEDPVVVPAQLPHLRHRATGFTDLLRRPDHSGSQRRLSLPERSDARAVDPPGADQQRADRDPDLRRPCVPGPYRRYRSQRLLHR
ncbi:hypothetical protein D9M71_397400 [compost metagenome]